MLSAFICYALKYPEIHFEKQDCYELFSEAMAFRLYFRAAFNNSYMYLCCG